MLKAWRREFVQLLRLLEAFDAEDLHAAVKKALKLGAIGVVPSSAGCCVRSRSNRRGPISSSVPAFRGPTSESAACQLHVPDRAGGSMTATPDLLRAHDLCCAPRCSSG